MDMHARGNQDSYRSGLREAEQDQPVVVRAHSVCSGWPEGKSSTGVSMASTETRQFGPPSKSIRSSHGWQCLKNGQVGVGRGRTHILQELWSTELEQRSEAEEKAGKTGQE